MKIFPEDASISPLWGMLKMVKDAGGEMSVSLVAERSGQQISSLLPLVEASTILGFATVKNGILALSKAGKKLTSTNFKRKVGEELRTVEPFRSALEGLRRGPQDTSTVAMILREKGIVLHSDMSINVELLKGMLLVWGTRTQLLDYDAETDEWKIVR